ncbi:MAG: hypothetical protein K2G26_04855, partial [Clostridia bacterium]|nr:hypothetical protein [Clostridia bacterium]
PAHAVFILATTEPQKIPATILSRCMRFDFKLIPQSDLEALIKSVFDRTGKQYEDEAVAAIARAGNGSARDSLSIADMCASYSLGKLTYDDVNQVLGKADFFAVADVVSAIIAQNGGDTLNAAESVLSTGKGVGVLLRDLLSFMNNLAVVKMCRNAEGIVNLPKDKYEKLQEIASRADGHAILRTTEILTQAEGDMRFAVDGRITLEAALIKAAMPRVDYDIEALLARMEKLERAVAEGIKVEVKTKAAPIAETNPVAETPVAETKPVAEKPKLTAVEDDDNSPFAEAPKAQPMQPEQSQSTLFEHAPVTPPAHVGSLSDADKATLFGRFIRLFRTTRRNAVLFTLCMDLESSFEGDTFVLTTTAEAVYKSLNREDNRQSIAEALESLGVFSYDIRLKPKGEDKYEKAIGELRENFKGTDITIK